MTRSILMVKEPLEKSLKEGVSCGLAAKKHMKQRFFQSFLKLMFLMVFSCVSGLYAATFIYKPSGNEPTFSVDVPDNWERVIHLDGQQAQILFYNSRNDKSTYLEVRAIYLDKETTTRELMHELTARLSLRFYFVELLKEEPAPFRPDIHTARWKIREDNKKFLATTAIMHQGKKALVLIAIAPVNSYRKQSVFFDNAVLSLKFAENPK